MGEQIKLMELSPRAQQLLFHVEKRAVEHDCVLDMNLISMDDEVILIEWDQSGFVTYGRIFKPMEGTSEVGRYCLLSDDAMRLAAEYRRSRARKNYANRDWLNEGDARKMYAAMVDVVGS